MKKLVIAALIISFNFLLAQNNPFIPAYEINESKVFNQSFTGDLVSTGYTFSSTIVAYTPITGGTVLGSISNNDEVFNNNTSGQTPPVTNTGFSIGFNFTYDYVSYDKFAINTNGWIVLGTGSFPIGGTTSQNYTPISTVVTTGFARAISPLGINLRAQTGSVLRYETIGTAPNRTLIVQWSGYRANALGESYNFQIRLNESSNTIVFSYGSFTVSTVNPPNPPQVGFRGIMNTDWNNRSTSSDWAFTTSGASNTSTVMLTSAIKPVSGQTFTWTPTVSSNMTFVSSTTTQLMTTVINKRSTNNHIIGIKIVMSGSLSPISVTSFNLNTNGSSNPPVDITNAKIFYTGSGSEFDTLIQYGVSFNSPNGAFTINGSQSLSEGTNYFWLTYDVPCGAVTGNLVDGECLSITGDGAMGTKIPDITNPGSGRVMNNAFLSQIGTGTVTAQWPYNTFSEDSKMDALYTASEITSGGCASSCGNITSIGFNVSSASVQTMNNFNIKMQHTSTTSLTGFTNSGWTTVYSGAYTVQGTGWQHITLTTPFPWNGSNVLIEICFDNTSSSSPTLVLTSNTIINRVAEQNNDNSNGCTFTAPSIQSSRPNIQFLISPGINMSYSSSTTTQTVTSNVTTGTNANQIIGIEIVTPGSCNAFSVTNFSFNTNGSTNPVTDISGANVYYTGNSNVFAATTLFGSVFSNPNGSFSFTNSRSLLPGTNYFWLVYNIRLNAVIGNVVDAECTSITVNAIARTLSVTAPAGSRTIVGPLSGNINVGNLQAYPTLTGPGGLFEAINTGGLSGNITALITSDITETGSISLNQWTEFGGSSYTLTIKPADPTVKTISGNAPGGLINFNRSDRVTIDGSGGFTGRGVGNYLTFRNTNGIMPTFTFINDSKLNTIKFCNIESNNSDETSGTIFFGSTTATQGNDSNVITNCIIRDRSDFAGYPANAIYSFGNTSTSVLFNSNNIISNNQWIYSV